MAVKGNKLSIQVRLVCPILIGKKLKNHRAQYAVIEIEDGELVNIQFRKVAYDYEAELELAKSKGLPFIEMYEELRREDNYQGHNLELLASLNRKAWVCRGCEGLF